MGDWTGFDPTAYTAEDWRRHVFGLDRKKMLWTPKGLMAHATGMPTLGQWVEMGSAHDARLKNLEAFYQGLGWRHGPHAFVSRSHVNGFSTLYDRGTHCSCVNSTHLGLEEAGNFNPGYDDYNSGDGAMVRDMFAIAASPLCLFFDIDPDGILPHSSCKADGHSQCPGALVDMAALRLRVKAQMLVDKGPPVSLTTSPKPVAAAAPPPGATLSDPTLPGWPWLQHPFFERAARAKNKWLAEGKSDFEANGWLANEEAECAFQVDAIGDHGTAFGLHQWREPRISAILKETGINVRTDPLIEKHIEATVWELAQPEFKDAADAIAAAKTSGDAAAAICLHFEKAGAPSAMRRRYLMAQRWDKFFEDHPGWLAQHPAQA